MEQQQRTAWLVVASSAVGLFFHFGSLLVNSFGVFLPTLSHQFGWTRGQISFAFTLATLTAMLTMPLTGWLTDRLGARRPVLFSTVVFGALFAALALLTPQLSLFYALFFALGLVGPGTSAVPHASLIARWFTARRGLALGCAMCGTALGGVIWPAATQALTDRFGWRMAYALMGGAVLLVAVPLLAGWCKEPAATGATAKQMADETADGLSRKEALRGSLFWMLMLCYVIVAASIQACMIHLPSMLQDRGMTAAAAAAAASVLGATGMAGRLGTGYLLDLLPAERVPTLAFACVAAGIFLLFAGAGGGSGYLAAALIGFGYGAESATIPYLVSRYFGLRSFGEIYSYLFITVPLGGALGPVLMGVSFDRAGSYQTPLLVCGAATLAAALLMLRLGSYAAFAQRDRA